MSTSLEIISESFSEKFSAPTVAVEDLIRAFLDGRKETTLAAYRQSLSDFAEFCNAASETSAHAASVDDAARILLSRSHGEANLLALKYRANLIERDLAAATVNARLAALRSLVALANTLGLVPWELKVSGVKAQSYRDTRGPGRDGVRAVLSQAGQRGDGKGIRDTAIVRLLHDLGLRRAEVVGLDVDDVDLETGTVAVVGKGRTDKEAFTLPEPTAASLRHWMDTRGPEPGPLFVNFDRAGKGCRLSGRSVHRIVKRLGEDVRVKARPHGLRHAAITQALDETGGDVRAVQRFSRHADVRTLQAYDDNRSDLAGAVAKMVAIE